MPLRCNHFGQIAAVLVPAVFLVSLVGARPDEPPKKVALLVGINKYDKRGFAELPLRYAERDAQEMADELKKAGFEVRLLLGSNRGGDRALRANLERALEALLKGRNADDIVLIGLAGHGVQMAVKGPDGRSREEAFFCPADAVQGEPDTLLSMTDLIDRLNRKGGRNLVLVDACRNDPTPGRGARGIDGDTVEKLPLNTAVLFSCSKGQRAYESAQASGGHGIFFHFVLEGLRGGAQDASDQVTWGGLAEYVKNKVTPQRVKELQPAAAGDDPQTPHEVANLRGRSPVLVDLGKVQRKGMPKNWRIVLGGGEKLELVRIDPGMYLMGSPRDEKNRNEDEELHEVEITRPFYLGKYPVTRGQFRAFVKAASFQTDAEVGNGGYGVMKNGNRVIGTKWNKEYHWQNPGFDQTDEHPVVNVSWHDAIRFCGWVSKKADEPVRLPTEAEWEYACRAGTRTRYFFGNDEEDLAQYANVADASNARVSGGLDNIKADDGYAYTSPVGKFKPNAWGLYDMHGNVWQWCQDWYGPYDKNHRRDPQGPNFGKERVLRGGCWNLEPWQNRSAQRTKLNPQACFYSMGFRVVLQPRP